MLTIVSGILSLPWFRNNGAEKLFTMGIFSLDDQNSFDKSFSQFQFWRNWVICLISTPIIYETRTLPLHHVLSIPKCMAGKQLSYSNIVGFHQQSVYMASNVKKKYKTWLYIIKKHLGRGNFVLFSKLFPHFVVCKHKIHATKYMQAYLCSVSLSYYLHLL